MRRFMQTFVLAPQSPKKYYVHNDIFRYQDEVFHDSDNDTETQEEAGGRLRKIHCIVLYLFVVKVKYSRWLCLLSLIML